MINGRILPQLMVFCYKNGTAVSLALEEAHSLLWSSNLGYVVKANWYRYVLDPFDDCLFLRERKLGGAELEFIFALHTRKVTALTRQDLPNRNGSSGVTKGAFVKRASRFCTCVLHKIPKGVRRAYYPIERHGVPNTKGKSDLGYMLKKELTWLMIVDLDEESRGREPYFDWSALLQPPGHLYDSTA